MFLISLFGNVHLTVVASSPCLLGTATRGLFRFARSDPDNDDSEPDLQRPRSGKGLLLRTMPTNRGKMDNMNFVRGAGNFVFEVNQYPL
jgi:hypothetical protein